VPKCVDGQLQSRAMYSKFSHSIRHVRVPHSHTEKVVEKQRLRHSKFNAIVTQKHIQTHAQ
jgi:hypothetical protein